MSDPGTSYRSRDEIQEVRQTRDPITSFREKITSTGLVTVEELKKIEAEIRGAVDDAQKKAKLDNEVPMEELTTDVYANPENIQKIRGTNPQSEIPHATKGRAVNL